MVSEKRHKRSSGLGKYSLISCFTGGTETSNEPAASYEKLSTHDSKALSGPNKPPTIRLGGRGPAISATVRPLSCSSVVVRDTKGALGGKVKEACEQALEVAKKSTPHIGELFVGGQLFLHVNPANFGHKAYKQRSFSPSIGFLHVAAPNVDAFLQER